MTLNLNTFTPSTTIESDKVNENANAIQSLLNAVRPTLFVPIDGTISPGINFASEFTMPMDLTLNSISLRSKTGPTGAALIVDINQNGTTIFSTRPQINAGETTGGEGAVFNSTAIAIGDILTFDIDQVGSTISGSDLNIGVVFEYP